MWLEGSVSYAEQEKTHPFVEGRQEIIERFVTFEAFLLTTFACLATPSSLLSCKNPFARVIRYSRSDAQ